MEELLLKYGLPSLFTTIYTAIPSTAEQQIEIAKTLPTQIGRIYGMSIYTDTVTPDNKALITTTEAQNLYLSFKEGMALFVDSIRLDDMLTNFSGAPTSRPTAYLPVNIPNTFDLSTSFYQNPTGIVAGANNKTIALNLWYISELTYKTLLNSGAFMVNARLQGK